MPPNRSPRGLAVAGNGTLDVLIEGMVSVKGPNITIWSENAGIAEFVVEDPPVERGQKHTVNENIGDILIGSGLWHRYAPGGGGFNTLTALRDLQENEGLWLAYLDVSKPTSSTMEALRRLGMYDSHHFWRRDMPTNVIVGFEGDRIVLKSPQRRKYSPLDMDGERAEHYIKTKDGLLINSVKDPGYVELYIRIAKEYDIPVFFSVTTSLDWVFVRDKVLPSGTVVLNYDDLVKTHGLQSGIDEQIKSRGDCTFRAEREIKMDLALEVLKEVRALNPDKNAYVTMGENGVYVSSQDGIYHLALREDYAKLVKDVVRRHRETTNAAGDYFFAAIALHEVFSEGMPAVDIAIKASEVAIRHIGYWGPLPREAFNVLRPHPILRAA